MEYLQYKADHWRRSGGKIFKMMSFAGSSRDVADPWYTGDFEATWKDVTEGCQGLLQYILEENGKASKNKIAAYCTYQ